MTSTPKDQPDKAVGQSTGSSGATTVELPKPTADQMNYLENNIRLSTATYNRHAVIGGRRVVKT